jgi:hypothetical protein
MSPGDPKVVWLHAESGNELGPEDVEGKLCRVSTRTCRRVQLAYQNDAGLGLV